jgi:hypothetical protein
MRRPNNTAYEKAGIEADLNRCRALAQRIEGELRVRRSERFADLLSLAELQAALERAAWVLERKSRRSAQTSEQEAQLWSRTRWRSTGTKSRVLPPGVLLGDAAVSPSRIKILT